MKKLVLIAICLVFALSINAESVTQNEALAKASQFMPGRVFSIMQTPASKNKETASNKIPYYVFNAQGNAGFVIVSGDDRAKPILGYSETGAIDGNNLPENVSWWLDYYAEAIAALQDSEIEPVVRTETARKEIKPLIKTKWDQSAPYWDQCVFSGVQCLTGCVATATAQVMNYYQYPSSAPAISAYSCDYSIPALSGATLSWSNMCNSYSGSETSAQKKAVATLMRYCGQALLMSYGKNSSSAATAYVPLALIKYFKYNKSTHAIYRDGYDANGWESAVYNELEANNPVIYAGHGQNSGGHSFVTDGYKDGLFHVNWGWGGANNGYFALTVMDAYGPNYLDWAFSKDQVAIVGLKAKSGGSLNYPLMTVCTLEATSETVTRSTSSDNFSVGVSWKVCTSANTENTTATYSLGLYKGSQLVKKFLSYNFNLDPSYYWQYTNYLSFGSDLDDGTYKLCAIYTDTQGNVKKMQGFDYRYVEVVKKGNKLTLTNLPKYGGVKLNKTKVTIGKGKTVTLTASLAPAELENKTVTWKSSNKNIATVTTAGKVKGVAAGTATITCTSSTGQSATCKVTVAEISLDKTELAVEKGKTVTLKATVNPSSISDQSVTWESSNTAVATVSTAGKVKGIKAGTATITCTSGATGVSTTCNVTVGYVKLDKSEVSLEKGKTVKLTPTVYPTSLEDKSVTWKSSNTAVATVSTAGKVKGVKAGTATITCKSVATGLSTTCKVTVGYVKLDKTEVSLEKGKTVKLTPTVYPTSLEDKSVTWKSSNTAVATVSTAGKVKGVKVGTATITCTSVATGLSTTCKVTVVSGAVSLNKTEAFVEKGKTMTLKATVTPSTLTDKSVTWKSSNTEVATVSSAGKVKGVKYGTVTITCTSVATGASATCNITVGKVVVNVSEITLKKSREIVLIPTLYPTSLADKSVTWKSSDKTVATVTSDGKVKGIAAGTATITCTSVATGLSGTCIVTVLATSEARMRNDETTGIENLYEEPAVVEPFDVYDLNGCKVLNNVTSLDGLPAGIYIVNGKKVIKK
jgi:uncharacterized protein YjdB